MNKKIAAPISEESIRYARIDALKQELRQAEMNLVMRGFRVENLDDLRAEALRHFVTKLFADGKTTPEEAEHFMLDYQVKWFKQKISDIATGKRG